jgi:hypothetical protein
MANFMEKQLDELTKTNCGSNYDCKNAVSLAIEKIKNMKRDLEEIKRIEDRLSDLTNYLNNNKETLQIMRDETKNGVKVLNDQTNHFSVENYQLDELNNNETSINKKMDLYIKQLKKLFYTICILIFIYFILISFNHPTQTSP